MQTKLYEPCIMRFLRQLIKKVQRVIILVTQKEVLEFSKIAKIFITDEEAKLFTKELNDVLKFVDMMNEVELTEDSCVH